MDASSRTVDRAPHSANPATGSPCVVQYLYVHSPGEDVTYPSSRSSHSAGRLATRYLECVLVQAASLRWNAPDSELLLVSNLESRDSLTRRGQALLDRIESLGVELVQADYRHAPAPDVTHFRACRYVFDAIEAVATGRDPEQRLWMVDVDCLWLDPAAALAAVESTDGIGALHIGYPPDWESSGYAREDIGALGARIGPCEPVPSWVGGEILTGTAEELLELVRVSEQLDIELEHLRKRLPLEEHLLTLAGGLGRIKFVDLAPILGRIWTGRRHGAANPPDPEALSIWHLPSEKGLAFRRAADALLHGPATGLRADLASRERAAIRFNTSGTPLSRSLRDDSWIAAQHLRDALIRDRKSGPGRLQRTTARIPGLGARR